MQSVAAASPQHLVQQGIELYQSGRFNQAIALWNQALPQIIDSQDRAAILSNLALAYRQIGQSSAAIANWEQAIQIYRSSAQSDNSSRQQLANLLTEQAQVYNDLGQHQRAITLAESALEISKATLTEAAAKGVIGNAYLALGDYEKSKENIKSSLEIAKELNNAKYITAALNDLGNLAVSQARRYRTQADLARSEGNDPEATKLTEAARQAEINAIDNFRQSIAASQTLAGIDRAKALLNLDRLLETTPSPNKTEIIRNRNHALALIESAPDSRDKAYLLIALATSLKPRTFAPKIFPVPQFSALLLEKAAEVSKNIGDSRAESFALNSLGQFYETAGKYEKAMELTRQAQFFAQQVNAADSLYRAQWQTARLLKATGKKTEAIAAYQQAIATLKSIRGDILAAKKELQFDFRDEVEPVYRQLMEMLLQPQTKDLGKVIDTLESLKLAELQNFFGDDCVQAPTAKGEQGLNDPNAVVIYSVILDDRTEIILQKPDGSMNSYQVNVGKQQMQVEIDNLRRLLESRESYEYLDPAKKIYDLLIRPLEANLAATNPKTLVFINDGVLRKVPMSALHDGQQFLIEKYAIATTPATSLTATKPLDRRNLNALILGLTVGRDGFAALPGVGREVSAVKEILGGTDLVDDKFTVDNWQTQFKKNSYPVVHIATHGQFGIDAKSTFLLGYNARINIEQIDNLLRLRGSQQRVALLTLSACQTAAGDNRSALGIAGVAVRAGVDSALATLWSVNDAATVQLIKNFYDQLQQHPEISKAEALRRAQISMITNRNYDHPVIWSPFILIGNWL